MNYFSKNGEENYLGNLRTTVVYKLNEQNEITIDYYVTTDKATPIDLTQHGYWNIAGQGSGTILDHIMYINASSFVPTDSVAIPIGKIAPVVNTPMDFTTPIPIGSSINADNQQLKLGKGYEHNWVLNKKANLRALGCYVYNPKCGRVLDIYTTEPCLQFYSGNFLGGTIKGKGGKIYNYRSAIVSETQHSPVSPNNLTFPSTILRPRQQYTSITIYKFCSR